MNGVAPNQTNGMNAYIKFIIHRKLMLTIDGTVLFIIFFLNNVFNDHALFILMDFLSL